MSGLVFHVINRGSRRGWLFDKEADFYAFEEVLILALEQRPIPLLEFCLMGNHFHLVVQPANDQQLPAFMHWLTTTHARRWRLASRTIGEGAVYQARYKAIPVQTEDYFFTLMRYVQRNPVRALLVARVEEWRWSGLWHRLHGDRRLRLAEWPLPRPTDWLDSVNEPQATSEILEIRKSTNSGYPLGNESWQKEVAKQLGLPELRRGRGRPPQR
jgi:putative transposase